MSRERERERDHFYLFFRWRRMILKRRKRNRQAREVATVDEIMMVAICDGERESEEVEGLQEKSRGNGCDRSGMSRVTIPTTKLILFNFLNA